MPLSNHLPGVRLAGLWRTCPGVQEFSSLGERVAEVRQRAAGAPQAHFCQHNIRFPFANGNAEFPLKGAVQEELGARPSASRQASRLEGALEHELQNAEPV